MGALYLLIAFMSSATLQPLVAQDAALRTDASAGLKKAAVFFRDKVSTNGAYLSSISLRIFLSTFAGMLSTTFFGYMEMNQISNSLERRK
jgi:hypothetical protein